MITALANNELEIADLDFASFAIAVQNAGMTDLRVIADEFQDGVEGYYTDEYFVLKDGPIQSVKDLKGKVVATNVAGSAVDIIMRAMLRKNGMDDRKDVSTIETAFPNMKPTLLSKKADAIPGVIPFSFDPELRAATRVLFTQKEVVGRTQMILCGDKCVASYNPHDGHLHWIIDGPTEQFVASPVFSEETGLVYITAGYPDHHILAIRPDGTGDGACSRHAGEQVLDLPVERPVSESM